METKRKSFDELDNLELQEKILELAGKWRGAAILDLIWALHDWGNLREYWIAAINAMWWGVKPETIIDNYLQEWELIAEVDNTIPF